MTKKHYESIAASIKSEIEKTGKDGWESPFAAKVWKTAHETTALNMADIFAADNPRFDKSRFLAACGL